MTNRLDLQGVLCPMPSYPGRAVAGEIRVHSRAERRFKCRRRGRAFAATAGTPFYRLHHEVRVMAVVLALPAHDCPVQAVEVAFGLREETVRAWLLRGGLI